MTEMPASHSVSVGWQIVFTFLPVVNFWAFYRIRKLRKYVLYIVVPEIAISAIIFSYMLDSSPLLRTTDSVPISNDTQIELFAISYSTGIALTGLTIYLVIVWSRKHNRQFDQPAAQQFGPPS